MYTPCSATPSWVFRLSVFMNWIEPSLEWTVPKMDVHPMFLLMLLHNLKSGCPVGLSTIHRIS